MKNFQTSSLLTLLLAMLLTAPAVMAQDDEDGTIVLEPEQISLQVNASVEVSATAYDADGNALADSVIFYTGDGESIRVEETGKSAARVTALRPGTFDLYARTVGGWDERITASFPVEVSYPALQEIVITDKPGNIYAGTVVPINYDITDQMGFDRDTLQVTWSSSDPDVARVDRFNRLQAGEAGSATLTASVQGVQTTWELAVQPNPVTEIELTSNTDRAVTGEVVRFTARPLDASGSPVSDMPLSYSFSAQTDDDLGEGSSGLIKQDGRFVANMTGLFTVTAKAGGMAAEHTIRVDARNVQKEVEVVGHGLVSDVHTSDLWVWEGVDGGDYALTGTWGANGEAYFWDVTDPANMSIIDTVTVDARTVNDVKVSEDGRVAVITREGASDRKNGIFILDITDPHNVTVHSEFEDGLTGGVHNAFIYEDHVFAVNNGRRYDIINIEDPKNPYRVSRFELDTPGHSIHDVWVENGIAYSSNWGDGVVAVDVGSTPAAQSPEGHAVGAGSLSNPVQLGSYAYPSGRNHAAFPFKSESTGDFYVIAGDESFPNGINTENEPTVPAGYMHFIKFEGGWDSPKEVARYQIPEAGTHNFWVKGDTLYIAYYNAGLRVVDISGELMGNLYEQGREIAHYVPTHHEGRVPNAPMAWGPQPYKGYIFMSDWNSGLWALKLVDPAQGTN
ncbi:MAG: hypothetical protein U5K31_01065 [Balneolaceae bacterium]|nr:hypothetical protein [Balneolaceae bacterium]